MMGTNNVTHWLIFQHTLKTQQQDVPSAYNTYIPHTFYRILKASLSLDFLYFLCKSVTSQIFISVCCHNIKLHSVNSMITKFGIWHPGLLPALVHTNTTFISKQILFTFPITKACWHGIIHPNKENLFHVILIKDSTKKYLQIQHQIVLIIKINIIYTTAYS